MIMKQLKRLTMTLALLIMAVGGAWAQSSLNVVEFAVPANWATDNSYVTAADLTGFNASTLDKARAWGAPAEGYVVLFYAFDGDGASYVFFENGTFSYDTTTPFQKTAVFNNSKSGMKFFYTTGPEPTEWSLTPDETGKKWTLDKMPASNVELQVEYFAESNLFLSKDALADAANITVTAGEDPVAFNDDGKSANTVTEGSAMTVKFNGTKKVLGVKVEKKSASKLASEVTPDDIFKVIASDGMIYDNIAAAESAGTVAQGLVVYVGSGTGNDTYTHGMALALKDEGNYTWSGAKNACNAKNTSTPIVGALWIQASKDQWITMFNAAGGDCKLRDCFSSAGGTNLKKVENYWAGSSHEDSGEQGDYYTFSDNNLSGTWCSTSVIYNNDYLVRPCIVF